MKLPLMAGVALLAATARGEESKVYLDVDTGVAFLPSMNVLGGDQIDFDTGVRADLRLGYHVSPWAAVEANTGVIWNSVDKIGGVKLSSFDASMELYQIPFMGNLVFSCPKEHKFRPYVGVGIGGVAGILDFTRPLGNIRDCDFTFSYQAFAGVTYAISSRTEIGVGYRFQDTFNHRWSESGVSLDTEGTATHSFVASFRWNF